MDTAREKARKMQEQTLDQLADCEAAISQLYETYGGIFSDRRESWMRLSEQEAGHARLLRGLRQFLDNGYLLFNLGRFTGPFMPTITQYLAQELRQSRAGGVSFLHAVSVALSLENTILESHFYDVVVSDAPSFKLIAARLASDTQGHVLVIGNMQ